MDRFDAIVIGRGHNGLVAGAYLAKAGARTAVLEARHKTGGVCGIPAHNAVRRIQHDRRRARHARR